MKKIYPLFLILMILVIQRSDAQQWMPVGVASTSIIRGMYFLSEDTGYVCTELGGIAMTVDGGVNWIQQTTGVATALRSIFFLNASVGYSCGFGGVILKTSDGGATWADLGDTILRNLRCIQWTSELKGYAAGAAGVIQQTTDGGVTWSPYNLGTTSDVIQLHFVNENLGFAVASGSVSPFPSGFVYKTTDGGTTWTIIHEDAGVGFLGLAVVDENHIVIGGSYQTIKQTTDGGTTWSIVTNNTTGTPAFRGGIAASPDRIFMIDDGSNIFSTLDGGTTWNDTLILNGFYSISFPYSTVGYIGDQLGTIYKIEIPCAVTIPIITFTDGILYSSASSGNQWYYNGALIPGATNSSYEPTANGTYSVTVSDDAGCSASSGDFEVIGVGIEDALQQNDVTFYPNPVSDVAVISLPKNFSNEKSSLMIYDLQGSVIYSNAELKGDHIEIDLSALAAGMYQYRIFDQNQNRIGNGKFIMQ